MDYAGVLIPMQCFLFKKHLTDEPRWKTKLQKAHEVLAGAKECQVKIPSANLALCGTQRGKEAGVQARIPSGALEEGSVWRRVGDCRSHSKDGAEPAGTESFQELGSTGPKQPHLLRGALF